jgi:tetratricopeptide (TPR) repeat protein
MLTSEVSIMNYALRIIANQRTNRTNPPSGGIRTINEWTRRLIAAGFLIACASSTFWPSESCSAAASVAPLVAIPSPGQERASGGKRFDYQVREDFFAGFAGDQTALERAMKTCEQALAANPKHAQAMVWHGSGVVFMAGQAFRKGDIRNGIELWDKGLGEMDRAVELEPDNVAVLVPRGSSLLVVSRFAADPAAKRSLLEKGVNDYEKSLELQKSYFSRLSAHARGELLFGLAEGWSRLGNTEKARAYFQRIADEIGDSPRGKEAIEWLKTGKLSQTNPVSCTGCHK